MSQVVLDGFYVHSVRNELRSLGVIQLVMVKSSESALPGIFAPLAREVGQLQVSAKSGGNGLFCAGRRILLPRSAPLCGFIIDDGMMKRKSLEKSSMLLRLIPKQDIEIANTASQSFSFLLRVCTCLDPFTLRLAVISSSR